MTRTGYASELAAAEAACAKLGYTIECAQVDTPLGKGWIAFGVPQNSPAARSRNKYGPSRLAAAQSLAYVLTRRHGDSTPHTVH